MGCSLGSMGGEDSKQKEKNKEINRLLEQQRRALDNEIKLLLLGTSPSNLHWCFPSSSPYFSSYA